MSTNNNRLKRSVPILAGLSVLLILFFNKAYFYTESYAKRIATEEFMSFVKRKGLKAEEFDGPNHVIMNSKWSFDWVSKKNSNQVFGININNDGSIDKYSSQD